MSKSILLLGLSLLAAPTSYAITKCIDQNGKVTYTDEACPETAKIKEVHAPVSRSSATEPEVLAEPKMRKPLARTSAEIEKNALLIVERDRREKELVSEIENTELSIHRFQYAMDTELAQLRNQKSQANNNLAGATWENSLSLEMQAVVTKYDTRIKVAAEREKALREELKKLRASK